MENVLETVTVREYPVIADIKKAMMEKGAENALMSGSGPTVFGIFKGKEAAEAAVEDIKKSRACRSGIRDGIPQAMKNLHFRRITVF